MTRPSTWRRTAAMHALYIACCLQSVFATGAAQAEDHLRVAVVADMSSPGAPGPSMALAVKLALDDARISGKLTHKVTLVVMDDQCKPDLAHAKAREVGLQNHVSLAIGHSCSGASMAASTAYQEFRVLQIDPVTTNPALTERNRGKSVSLFRVAERQDRAAAVAVIVLRDAIAGKNVSLIGGPHQKAWFDRFQALTAGKVNRFTTRDTVPDDTTASDVSIVYDPNYLSRDMSGAPRNDNVYAIYGPDDRFGVSWGDKDAVQKLVERLKQERHAPPFGSAINAYAAAQVWVKALKAAGSADRDRIVEQMRKLKFDTIRGTIAFDETGDVQQPLITIVRYSNPIIQVPNQCNEPACKDCKCSECCRK
jgi:branched-chain amino acid transport system substrate-binding protein